MPSDQPDRNSRGPRHLGESVNSIRTLVLLGGPLFLFMAVAETFWYSERKYGGFIFFLLLVPGNLLIIWALASLIERAAGGTAKAFATTVLGSGNIAPDPGFSSEEAMIIQGRLEDAKEALRQRLAAEPELHQAALRLGALLMQMDRHEDAERVYLDLRHHQLPSEVATTVANRLIDLYQRDGRTDRLKVELARFSGEHKGTGAGEHAARRLRELKEAEREQNEEAAED
jgi:tetratricopeptide (TPR) repeat protein